MDEFILDAPIGRLEPDCRATGDSYGGAAFGVEPSVRDKNETRGAADVFGRVEETAHREDISEGGTLDFSREFSGRLCIHSDVR
jgi:hypothetical protein